jgi:CubicO group peptidase (beta-lactamase class C family)
MQCSQTKGFCGVTMAILVEEGRISLDDPVSKYLPEFKNMKVIVKDADGKTRNVPARNQMTVRMLMNHTAGVPFEIPTKSRKGWPALSLRNTAKEAAAIPLRFEPGTKVAYSNTGIDIGAAVIEVVTGKPWEVFLKERVLQPLGMEQTTFNPTDEQLANSMSLYFVKKGEKAQFRKFHPSMPLPHNGPNIHPSAGAGLWTTANDQLKFYKMLMNLGVGENGVRILKEETVKSLLATSTRPAKFEGYSMGLRTNFKSGTMGHGGAWGTNCTVNWRKKELRLKVVQLLGSARPWDAKIGIAANKFFKMKIDDSGTDAYTGRMK